MTSIERRGMRARETARWYLSTWHTPEWRTVLVRAVQALAMGAWFMVNDAARSDVRAGHPWEAVFPAWALRSLAPALVMVAVEALRMRRDGKLRWASFPAAALAVGVLGIAFAAHIAGLRDPALAHRLYAAAALLAAPLPFVGGERGRAWWLWPVACLAAAVWLTR